MKVEKIIYQFWTDDNQLTPNRKNALQTNVNFGVESKLLFKDDIKKYELPESPYHPAYKYLSSVHKSDYLRCYFMHHFGGGYADIKSYSKDNNWKKCFEIINSCNDIFVIGQEEIMGGSPIAEYNNYNDLKYLVANGYFIVRPHTEFTEKWFKAVNEKLDSKLEQLKNSPPVPEFNPSINVFESSTYPLRWAEIQGEIFHKICYEFKGSRKVNNCLITGRMWNNYR